MDVLTSVQQLQSRTSEKGGAGSATPTGWSADSVFNFIDDLGIGSEVEDDLKDIDLMV